MQQKPKRRSRHKSDESRRCRNELDEPNKVQIPQSTNSRKVQRSQSTNSNQIQRSQSTTSNIVQRSQSTNAKKVQIPKRKNVTSPLRGLQTEKPSNKRQIRTPSSCTTAPKEETHSIWAIQFTPYGFMHKTRT